MINIAYRIYEQLSKGRKVGLSVTEYGEFNTVEATRKHAFRY